jgi:hypothetical protein
MEKENSLKILLSWQEEINIEKNSLVKTKAFENIRRLLFTRINIILWLWWP